MLYGCSHHFRVISAIAIIDLIFLFSYSVMMGSNWLPQCLMMVAQRKIQCEVVACNWP